MIRRLWLMAAVACAMWIFQVTAFPQTSETLSVEDVRRPVYRGNHRYKFFLPNLNLKDRVIGKPFKLFLNVSSSVRTNSYEEEQFRNGSSDTKFMYNNGNDLSKEINQNNIDWRNEHKKMLNTTEDSVVWSQVQLTTSSNESAIVENFVENSLYDLEKNEDKFKKVILPINETETRHTHIYPSSSPPSWIEGSGVILVEDVHPSKLPKPPSYNEVPLYHQPSKPSVNYDYKPTVSKPSNDYGILESFYTKPPIDYNYPKPAVSKPVYPHQDIDTSTKPVDVIYFNPKPVTMKPIFDIVDSGVTTHQPISVTLTNVLNHFTPVYTKPPPEPPPRPPPPTIVVIEPPSDNYIDCGNIQVVNSATYKHCPDVTVVLNNKQNISALSPAPDANVQAAAVVPVSPVNPANGLVPLVSPPITAIPKPPIIATPKPPITITVTDVDDEEYDYEDDEVANDVVVSSTTTSPKPSKPSSSTSLLGYLQTLVTSLPFIGPISVSIWIIFLGPLSFLLLGAMGVASFIFPWLAPRLVFGRSGSGLYFEKPIIPHAANLFLKNIKLGTFETKNW